MIKRKIVLINPSFQLKLGLYLACIFLLSGMFYPIIILDVFSILTRMSQQYYPQLGNHLSEYKWDLVTTLISWEIGFLVIFFIITIFFTHRIAGPIKKATDHLQHMLAGKNSKSLTFRQGDYFPELAEAITQLNKKIEEQKTKNYMIIHHTIEQLCKIETVANKGQEILIKNLIANLSTMIQEMEMK